MDWSWAVAGITEETPRTTGPECINYMTNRRRWMEAVLFSLLFIYFINWAVKRMDPIIMPPAKEINKPHTAIRLLLLIAMTFVFGIEMGFKLAGQSVIFVMNPCHIQTLVQIYLLASKPSKTTIALFRIQMNNLNGPFLAFLFPEVECRTYPFEQATYWMQHALLYIIPVYILKSGAYSIEDVSDYNWVTIGIMVMLLYHFVVLNALSICTGINLNHMLCAALADPFQGQNYRIAAVIHESILCPILNKVTVLIFSNTSDNTNKYYQSNISQKKRNMAALRLNNLMSNDHQRRLSSGDESPTARIYHQQTTDKCSASAPTTPTLIQTPASAISEISLAAEMAAAIAGTGPVNVIRRLKQSNNSTASTTPDVDTDIFMFDADSHDVVAAAQDLFDEMSMATTVDADCGINTKLD